MPTQASNHEAVIAAAMTIAERNGYPTSAWRFFESEAGTALTAVADETPSLAPDHHDQFDGARLEPTKAD
jgi:hypothetical protein